MHRFSYQTFTFGRWYEHTIAGYTIVGFRTDIKLLEIFVHKNNRGKKRNRKWDSIVYERGQKSLPFISHTYTDIRYVDTFLSF